MNEHEQFLKLLDRFEIPHEVYWNWRLKRSYADTHMVETILEGAQKAQLQPLEFLDYIETLMITAANTNP